MVIRHNSRNIKGIKSTLLISSFISQPTGSSTSSPARFFKARVGICSVETRWQFSWICLFCFNSLSAKNSPKEYSPGRDSMKKQWIQVIWEDGTPNYQVGDCLKTKLSVETFKGLSLGKTCNMVKHIQEMVLWFSYWTVKGSLICR